MFDCKRIERLNVGVKSEEVLLRLADKASLVPTLLNLGFTSVSLDLEGLVSGKLNRVPVSG